MRKCDQAKNWTWDLPITRGTLFHLSYIGTITWWAHSFNIGVGHSFHSAYNRLERTWKCDQAWSQFFCVNYGWRNILSKFSINSVKFSMVSGISLSSFKFSTCRMGWMANTYNAEMCLSGNRTDSSDGR